MLDFLLKADIFENHKDIFMACAAKPAVKFSIS
jgi:hypothetical protein